VLQAYCLRGEGLRDRGAGRAGRRGVGRKSAACAASGVVDDCFGLQARLRLSGLGPAILSVMPVLCLLVLADGLPCAVSASS
jgi:hypothetical protein